MKLTNPLDVLNHLFFASLLLWFVVQHSALVPSPLKYGPTTVGQALQYQPRTPPPMLDPEQLDASLEEAESQPIFGLHAI
jgi:hypothetical protein